MRRDGFTLLEMAVVLAILAVLTRLAMPSLLATRKAALERKAREGLDALRTAVYDERPNGEAAGFLADMGRLPCAVEVTEGGARTLAELWTRPEGTDAFDFRPATRENLVPSLQADDALVQQAALVPCGWRGPYLSVSGDRALDAWGNAMETPDDAGFARLLDGASNEVVRGEAVRYVRHFGADGRTESDRTTVDLVPGGEVAARLLVSIRFLDENGAEVRRDGATTICRWWGPCGSRITGAVERVLWPEPVLLEGLSPGLRLLQVTCSGVSSLVERVMLRPGANECRLVLRAP